MDMESSVLGLGQGVKTPFTRLRGSGTHSVVRNSNSHYASSTSPSSTSSSGKPFNIANYVKYDKFSMRHKHFLAAISTVVEPASFK